MNDEMTNSKNIDLENELHLTHEDGIDWSSLDEEFSESFNVVSDNVEKTKLSDKEVGKKPIVHDIVEPTLPVAEDKAVDEITYERFIAGSDPSIIEVFIEESVELSSILRGLWDSIRQNPTADEERYKEFKRGLHTLKGNSALVSLKPLTTLIHQMEELLKLVEEERLTWDEVRDELSKGFLDIEEWVTWCQIPDYPKMLVSNVSALIEDKWGHQNKEIDKTVEIKKPLEAVENTKKSKEIKNTLVNKKPIIQPNFVVPGNQGDGNLNALIQKARELNKNKLPISSSVQNSDATALSKIDDAPVKLSAKSIDILLQEIGMWGATQSALDSQNENLGRIVKEFSENIDKIQKLLYEVKISSEAQMSARQNEVEVLGSRFDPLEMDRFTRLQESTRILAEGISDLLNVQSEMNGLIKQNTSAIQQQQKSARNAQEVLSEVRLVALSFLTNYLKKTVAQAISAEKKQATLILNGGDVRIDRSILEKIKEPLEHLLRNAVAHGIEKPEERIRKNKNPSGSIYLEASTTEKSLMIKCYDDGAGFNYEKIRQKAIDKHLIDANQEVSEADLRGMILMDKFSTAEEVSELAGRGVGLDVVKARVEQMGGRLGIFSEENKGAIFQLEVPLTILTTQAMHVLADKTRWCLPGQYVVAVHKVKRSELIESYKTGSYMNGDLVYLADILSRTSVEPVFNEYDNVVIEFAQNDRHLFVHVDSLINSEAVVIKPLKPPLNKIDGVIGVAHLGEGRINLMLQPFALANKKRQFKNIEFPENKEEIHIEDVKLKVMVVDDSSTVRKVTSNLLKTKNMEVFLAKDGVDALEQLQTILPDIMLIDLEMPRMNGFELAENVRKDPKLCHIPIVMITSRTADKHQEAARERGINAYLGKPYQDFELLSQIEEWTGRKVS